MRCVDEAVLWAYADGELPADERTAIEGHVSGCERCGAVLAEVNATRQILRRAAQAQAPVAWRKVDEAVMARATAQFARANRLSPWWGVGGVAGIAVAALVAFFLVWRPVVPSSTSAPEPVIATATPEVRVESAERAHVTLAQAEEQALEAGTSVGQGARIRTEPGGSALVRLPEDSRAKLGPGTEATISRAVAEAVEIDLAEGSVRIEASHAARDRFVVEAPEAAVRVVGTVFVVERDTRGLTVAVEEGRVLVEPRQGQTRLVSAGERILIQRSGVSVPEAGPTPRAAEAPAPRKAPRPSPGPVEVAAPAPAPDAPGLPLSELSQPEFISPPVERATHPSLPTSAEALFLRRAEEALKTGKCGAYLLGLADVTETSEDGTARETARILRARCYDERLMPVEAENEYRKYLERHPTGRFAGEAQRGLAY